MRKEIQPEYHQAQIKCACGNEFVAGSTKPEIRVELCSKCHPFYTGSQRLVTSAGGQVDKFKKRYNLEADE